LEIVMSSSPDSGENRCKDPEKTPRPGVLDVDLIAPPGKDVADPERGAGGADAPDAAAGVVGKLGGNTGGAGAPPGGGSSEGDGDENDKAL
jgi:hypothetical protein